MDAHKPPPRHLPLAQPAALTNISELVKLRALEHYEKRTALDLEHTIDVNDRERTIRETISQEKQRMEEAITARRRRDEEWSHLADIPVMLTQKDRRAISLLTRGSRLIQNRAKGRADKEHVIDIKIPGISQEILKEAPKEFLKEPPTEVLRGRSPT